MYTPQASCANPEGGQGVQTPPPPWKAQIKSNQFYWYKVQSQDCHQSHVYSYTRTITDIIQVQMTTNLVIDETMKYEKYGI